MFDFGIQSVPATTQRQPSALARCLPRRRTIALVFIGFAHLLGALTSLQAILEVRTAQGTGHLSEYLSLRRSAHLLDFQTLQF